MNGRNMKDPILPLPLLPWPNLTKAEALSPQFLLLQNFTFKMVLFCNNFPPQLLCLSPLYLLHFVMLANSPFLEEID